MFSVRRLFVPALVFGAVLVGGSAAQAQMGGGGFGGGGGGGGMANFDPTAIRDMLMQRFQQQLGATDEEWKVIQPPFMKVMQLQLDTGQGMMGALRGLGRGPGGPGGNQVNQMIQMFFGTTEPSMVSRREDDLQQAIDNNAAPEKIVAGGALLADAQDDGILIAVDVDAHDFLHVSRFLAFDPELLARARPISCLAGGQGFFESCGVHEGDHEHASGIGIDGDGGDQAVLIELEVEGGAEFLFGGSGHEEFSGRNA